MYVRGSVCEKKQMCLGCRRGERSVKEKADQNGRESTSTRRRQSFFEKGATWLRGRQRLRGKRELTEKSTLLRGKTGKERDKWKAKRSPEKAKDKQRQRQKLHKEMKGKRETGRSFVRRGGRENTSKTRKSPRDRWIEKEGCWMLRARNTKQFRESTSKGMKAWKRSKVHARICQRGGKAHEE